MPGCVLGLLNLLVRLILTTLYRQEAWGTEMSVNSLKPLHGGSLVLYLPLIQYDIKNIPVWVGTEMSSSPACILKNLWCALLS